MLFAEKMQGEGGARGREKGKDKGKGKGKDAKGMCVPGLLREFFTAKGVNVRCEEAPLVG